MGLRISFCLAPGVNYIGPVNSGERVLVGLHGLRMAEPSSEKTPILPDEIVVATPNPILTSQ